jgi:hypothetical protein
MHRHHRREGSGLHGEALGDDDGGKNQGGREGDLGAALGSAEKEKGNTKARTETAPLHSAYGTYSLTSNR